MSMRPMAQAANLADVEAGDVTEADRIRCRALIEAVGFHANDYEEDEGGVSATKQYGQSRKIGPRGFSP
jgi:hypothetical protein